MRYTCEIEINLPFNQTAELWEDENYFKHWHSGFLKIDQIEGQKGMVGSKSKIILVQGKRRIEIIETIIVNNLPKEKIAKYEHIHMINTQKTQFEEIVGNRTKLISQVEYIRFKGLLPKLLSFLFPVMFRNKSQEWLNAFKDFAENFDPLNGK